MHRQAILPGLALALAACAVDTPSVTPFPIPVDLEAGPVVTQVRLDDGDRITATVDTMSPLTVIDSAVPGSAPPEQRRRRLELTLMTTGQGVEPVARARFRSVDTLDLHPCREPGQSQIQGHCQVGMAGATRDIQGILGADLLARYAVRFEFRDQLMGFMPDITGSLEDRSVLCDSVFATPFYGGGTMIIGGTEISYPSRRMALGTCFFDTEAELDGRVSAETGTLQGVDGLFVVSTGLGITLITEHAYDQYRTIHPDAPPPEALPADTLYLPSGPVPVRLGTLTDMAIVGEASDKRGPCSERYANDFLSRCLQCTPGVDGCPCGDRLICKTGAVLELRHAFPVAVVAESEPTIQALRSELRPDLPELSGIIGASALEPVIMDVDYPNNRVIARCLDPEGCLVRPAVISAGVLQETRTCLPEPMTVCEPPAAVSSP